MTRDDKVAGGILSSGIGFLALVICGITCLCLWGCPQYHVWQQGMSGQAKLKEAESSRQVLIQEAKAKHEAAKELAAAEVERAKGVAEANKIIGEGLKGNHEYLIYLWIHAISDRGDKEVIYVPTEAGLPILEAGRFTKPVKPVEEKKK